MPRGRPKKVENKNPVLLPSELEAIKEVKEAVFRIHLKMANGETLTYRDSALVSRAITSILRHLDGGKFE